MRTSLAVALLAVSVAVPAQQLGTLFLSPAERERLDRHRRGESVDAAPGQAAVETRTPAVTGYVKRSDGRSTVFLDKRPYPVRDARLQGRLGPRIIDRFEPLPPEPVEAPPESPKSAQEPADPSQGSRKE